MPQGGPDGNFRPLRPRHPVSMLASVVCYAGLLAMLAGALSLIRPLRFLRIRSRRAGAVLAVVAVAVSVVTLRKQSGAKVTHAYFERPVLMRIVVPTASATDPRSWLAMPNIGQMVLMLPVQMK